MLYVREQNGTFTPAPTAAILREATTAAKRTLKKGEALESPEHAAQALQALLAREKAEVFAVLWMDTRHRVIAFDKLFHGTIDGASVHPREVVRAAIKRNAAAAIVTHNHPSGIPEPSQADISLTRRLKDALALIDVRVLDHVVVGTEGTVSLAERGLV